MRSLGKVAAVLVFLAWFPLWAWGQGGATGAISGTVQDASGAVIAGAKVAIVSEATGETVRDTATDSAGIFTAELLPVGRYTVQISAQGFASTKVVGVAVNITETTRMTAVLKVSSVSEKVEVSAEVETINTSAPTTGESLENTTITTLPLATRNFQTLLTLSAGASSDLNNASQLGRGQVVIHVNGGREDNNNYLIEGITASDYAFGELTYTPLPNPDAIDEFKVSTSLYDASQGRNGGGNINATLKSGTSSYHGDAWEYFRNTVLDANDWFIKQAGEPRPVIKQNIFGGDFGGQVDPNEKKWGFFYTNYQGTRQRSGASPGTFINVPSLPVLPPLAQRTPANLEALFNVPNVDPVALALLQATGTQFGSPPGGPLIPTVAGMPGLNPTGYNTGKLVFSSPGQFTDDQFTGTWDNSFNGDKDRVAFRFFWSDSETFEPFGADSFGIQTGGFPFTNNLNFPLSIPLHSRFGTISETHIFSPNVVNDLRFGVNIIGDKLVNHAIVTTQDLGITRPTTEPDVYRFQFGSFAIGSFPNSPQNVVGDTLVLADTVSVTHGPHTLRVGAEVDHTSLRRDLAIASNGLIFFAGSPAPSDFQGFLEGNPFFGEAGGGLATHNYKIPAQAAFAQDDYRVRRDLTLNLGLRLEFVGAPYDDQCHIGNVIPQLIQTTGQPFVYPTCVNAFKIPGLVGTENKTSLANNYTHVWEPRVGFAYDLFGHHTTSIRAGYGIYSIREDIGALDNLALSAPIYPIGVNFLPGSNSLSTLFEPNPPSGPNEGTIFPGIPGIGQLNPAFTPTPTFFKGFPAGGCMLGTSPKPTPSTLPQQCGAAFSGNIPGFIQLDVPQNWIVATTQQWNLTIQRELGHNWFAEIGYVGTKGTHLRATYDPDEATKATPANPVTIPGFNCAGVKAAGNSCVITDSTLENAPARAPFLGIAPANFEAFAPVSDSHYNGLQLTVAHRFAKGLYFQSAYTFSKSIDDVSTASVAFDTRFNDQLNARDSRGLSDFDRRHRFVTSFVYELPFFAQSTGFTHAALAGWETSGVLTLQSGLPFTPFDSGGGTAFAFSSPNLATPVFSPGMSCANSATHGGTEARLNGWISPAAFQKDPLIPLSNGAKGDATDIGNVPRNCFTGPPQANMDFTIGKSFKLTERQSLRFRTDFFNLTNHPSFAAPVSPDVEATAGGANPTFGLTSLVGTPRLIQFSLKYSF